MNAICRRGGIPFWRCHFPTRNLADVTLARSVVVSIRHGPDSLVIRYESRQKHLQCAIETILVNYEQCKRLGFFVFELHPNGPLTIYIVSRLLLYIANSISGFLSGVVHLSTIAIGLHRIATQLHHLIAPVQSPEMV